jgi:hypothetical protein
LTAAVSRIAVLAILCSALAACVFGGHWRDATGHGRSADHDAKTCGKEAGYPLTDETATPDETRAAFARMKICMAARGWKSTDQNPH